jgi:nucleotide-binding universal stress UspA family protein
MTADIATFMVPIDGDHPSDIQLKSVGALASEFGAGVIGISACEHTPSFYFAAGAVAADLLDEDTRRMKERMAAAEKRFRKALPREGVPFEWRSSIDIPIDFIARESRATDLLVCFSQPQPSLYSDVEPGELVLRSGRPVIVVPEGAALRSPSKILVSWKDSREARRALRDALPFLRRAKEIAVVEIMEEDESPKRVDARLRDVVAWLRAHAIAASKKVITPSGDVTDALAAAARDFDADLIVAGAYGHTRLGEWIFGGVTRHLLTKSSRPAFLSH